MSNMKGLELVVSQLRDQRTNLANQLKHVDHALAVLNKLERGDSSRFPLRRLSAAARRKIAAAQRARWARFRQQKKAA